MPFLPPDQYSSGAVGYNDVVTPYTEGGVLGEYLVGAYRQPRVYGPSPGTYVSSLPYRRPVAYGDAPFDYRNRGGYRQVGGYRSAPEPPSTAPYANDDVAYDDPSVFYLPENARGEYLVGAYRQSRVYGPTPGNYVESVAYRRHVLYSGDMGTYRRTYPYRAADKFYVGPLGALHFLAAQLGGTADLSLADLFVYKALGASLTGAAAATGRLTADRNLAVSIAAHGELHLERIGRIILVASRLQGVGQVDGLARKMHLLGAELAGSGALSGVLIELKLLRAALIGRGDFTAAVAVDRSISASLEGRGYLTEMPVTGVRSSRQAQTFTRVGHEL